MLALIQISTMNFISYIILVEVSIGTDISKSKCSSIFSKSFSFLPEHRISSIFLEVTLSPNIFASSTAVLPDLFNTSVYHNHCVPSHLSAMLVSTLQTVTRYWTHSRCPSLQARCRAVLGFRLSTAIRTQCILNLALQDMHYFGRGVQG